MGRYTVEAKNEKGSLKKSFILCISSGHDTEVEKVIQEVVTVQNVSENTQELEGSTDDLKATADSRAKEVVESELTEKVEQAEKLLVIDNEAVKENQKIQMKKKKKEKKKEMTVKKEVVTVHKVEEQVMEDGQTVREMSEAVSTTELESGADVGLTGDSLHKLEPFVMMEDRVQKTEAVLEESDEETEKVVKVKKRVKIVHQVKEKTGGEESETVEVRNETIVTTEAKEGIEMGVKAEKLEEVEKLIVIDNKVMEATADDAETKKVTKKMQVAVEESTTESELVDRRKAQIQALDDLVMKPQPKPWDVSESESDVGEDEQKIAALDALKAAARPQKPQHPEAKKIETKPEVAAKKPWDEESSATESESEEEMKVTPQQKPSASAKLPEKKPGVQEEPKKPWEESDSDEESDESEESPARDEVLAKNKPQKAEESAIEPEPVVPVEAQKQNQKPEQERVEEPQTAKKPQDKATLRSTVEITEDEEFIDVGEKQKKKGKIDVAEEFEETDIALKGKKKKQQPETPASEDSEVEPSPAKPEFLKLPEPVTTARGETVKLTCQVQGQCPVCAGWLDARCSRHAPVGGVLALQSVMYVDRIFFT